VSAFLAAAAQYPIEALGGWDAYARKIARWVEEAAGAGAKLAVFPEYGAMELASLDPATTGDLTGSMHFVAGLEEQVDALHRDLAMRHGLYILAASLPVKRGAEYRNAARLFAPSGAMGVQEKLVMTRFEREQWGVSPGGPLRLFDTALGRIGVLICYDSEFPLLGRALVEAGADLILVPSCTDSVAGYHRVRIGAQARALEGQCYAIHAPTVGVAEWSPAVDENHGAAAVYGPPDLGFAETGVEAMGEMDRPQWLFATVDPARVERVRREGAVFNTAHWSEQPGAPSLPQLERVEL